MNKTIFMGNLTSDPDVGETTSGKKYARFTLALQRMNEGADFPDIIAWEKKAEILEKYCRKGMKLLVEGRVHTWVNETASGKIYKTEFVADNIEFCERKQKDGTEGQPKDNDPAPFLMPEGVDEKDIPFN